VWDENERLWTQVDAQVSFQTKKVTKPVVLYEATDKHPAQVKEVSEDVNVAKIEKSSAFGMITSAQKHDMLNRLDTLLVGCKQARMRANTQEVSTAAMGKALMDFVLGNTAKRDRP
jgi:hypothetical protein